MDKIKEKGKLDLSGMQLKKWVKNISKQELTDVETKVLAWGLNYAVIPKEVPKENFILATELAKTTQMMEKESAYVVKLQAF